MIPKNFLLSVPSPQNRVTFTKVGMDVWIGVHTHTHTHHSLGTHDIDKLHTQVHILRISHTHIHLHTHTQEPNTNICTYMYAIVLNSIQIQIIFQQQLKCGWSSPMCTCGWGSFCRLLLWFSLNSTYEQLVT